MSHACCVQQCYQAASHSLNQDWHNGGVCGGGMLRISAVEMVYSSANWSRSWGDWGCMPSLSTGAGPEAWLELMQLKLRSIPLAYQPPPDARFWEGQRVFSAFRFNWVVLAWGEGVWSFVQHQASLWWAWNYVSNLKPKLTSLCLLQVRGVSLWSRKVKIWAFLFPAFFSTCFYFVMLKAGTMVSCLADFLRSCGGILMCEQLCHLCLWEIIAGVLYSSTIFLGSYFCFTRNHQTIFNLFLHFYIFSVYAREGARRERHATEHMQRSACGSQFSSSTMWC